MDFKTSTTEVKGTSFMVRDDTDYQDFDKDLIVYVTMVLVDELTCISYKMCSIINLEEFIDNGKVLELFPENFNLKKFEDTLYTLHSIFYYYSGEALVEHSTIDINPDLTGMAETDFTHIKIDDTDYNVRKSKDNPHIYEVIGGIPNFGRVDILGGRQTFSNVLSIEGIRRKFSATVTEIAKGRDVCKPAYDILEEIKYQAAASIFLSNIELKYASCNYDIKDEIAWLKDIFNIKLKSLNCC